MQSNKSSRQSPRFHALDVALELIGVLRPILSSIEKRDHGLAKQLRNAATSVPLNISEGNRRLGKDRTHLWSIAAGSADEARTCLLIAQAWGYVEQAALEEPLELLDRELAMLWRLTH